jgi:hypothetical protein
MKEGPTFPFGVIQAIGPPSLTHGTNPPCRCWLIALCPLPPNRPNASANPPIAGMLTSTGSGCAAGKLFVTVN